MDSIRTAIETACTHLSEHPEKAVSTDAMAIAVLEEGLRFRVEGPTGAVTTDMATSVGGGASAPTPAWLMRAALASCDATLIAMEAARDGVELTELKVSVDSETDFRGILGVDDSIDAARAPCGSASRWQRQRRRRSAARDRPASRSAFASARRHRARGVDGDRDPHRRNRLSRSDNNRSDARKPAFMKLWELRRWRTAAPPPRS